MAGSSVASRAMDLGVAMMVFEEFRDEAIISGDIRYP
jgi:hypothetical protein